MEQPAQGFPLAFPRPSPSPIFSEVRLQHYSNLQHILLVGEGDFSFSFSLARAFGSGSSLVATSLDSREKLLASYPSARITLPFLESVGAILIHGVDATTMASHELISRWQFDCIIYNFPHAGFLGPEGSTKVIEKHKTLMRHFFLNAAKLLKESGEIHVSHKVKPPYTKWNLEEEASECGLVLRDCCGFDMSSYPGYTNRRGQGPDCAKSFPLGDCRTFKFVLNPYNTKPAFCLGGLLKQGVQAIRDLFPKHMGKRRRHETEIIPMQEVPEFYYPENSFPLLGIPSTEMPYKRLRYEPGLIKPFGYEIPLMVWPSHGFQVHPYPM